MPEWKVGMEVSVWWDGIGARAPERIARVARVGKLKVTLDDGSEWNANHGSEWGERYGGQRIRPTDAEDRPLMASRDFRRAAILRLQNMRWRNLSDEQLRAVLAALPEEAPDAR